MTSQKSSANKISSAYDLKQSFKGSIIAAVAMVLTIAPRFLIEIISDIQGALYSYSTDTINLNKIHPDVLKLFREQTACMLTNENMTYIYPIACILFGFVFSFSFTFFMSKKNVNFYYSLPIDRAAMFKNRIISSVVSMAGGMFVIIFLDLMINLYYLGFSVYLIEMALALYFELMVYMLASFTIFTIAMVSCNTIIEGVFFGAGLYVLPTAVIVVVDNFCSGFLRGYSRASVLNDLFDYIYEQSSFTQRSLLLKVANINPFLLGTKFNADGYRENIVTLCYKCALKDPTLTEKELKDSAAALRVLPDMSYIAPLIIWSALIVVGIFLARKIFIGKKMENAAMHGSNRITTAIFVTELSVCVASILPLAGKDLGIDKFLVFILTFVVIVAIYYSVISICRRRAFHDMKTYLTPVVIGGVIGVFCLVLTTGLFGYTAYAPPVEDIKAATITSDSMALASGNEVRIDCGDNYYNDVTPFDYGDSGISVGVFTEKDDIEKLISIAKNIAKSKGVYNKCTINVMYILENGKKVLRAYDGVDVETLKSILTLTDTEEYKSTLRDFLTKDNMSEYAAELKDLGLRVGDLTLDYDAYVEIGDDTFPCVGFCSKASVITYDNQDSKDIKITDELRKALADDLTSMSFEQRYFPSEKELCRVVFEKTYMDLSYFDENGNELDAPIEQEYTEYRFGYRIYPSMKNTVKYLEKVGALMTDSFFRYEPKGVIITRVSEMENRISFYSANSRLFESRYSEDSYSDEYYSMAEEVKSIYGSNKVKDKAKIESLKAVSRPYGFANDNDLIVLYVAKNEHNNNVFFQMLVPEKDVPAWVK